AAGDTSRAALLLPAAHPVWKAIVGDDVVHLRGRLVVPRAPGLPAVHGDSRALVARDQDDVRIFRIDPDAMVVVASRRAFDRGEVLATIGGAIAGSIRNVNRVRIAGINLDLGEVGAAAPDARFAVHLAPAHAGVVGA